MNRRPSFRWASVVRGARALAVLTAALAAGCDARDAADPADDAPELAPDELVRVLGEGPAGRRVLHPGGVDVVPLHPRDIAAFGIAIDDLVTLGITPRWVGTRWDGDVADYLVDRVEDSERIGTTGYMTGINVAQVWRARPDLIVVGNARQYRQLRRIAPTIVCAKDWADVSEYAPRVRGLGLALGMAAEAEVALAAHRARLQERAATLRSRLGDRSVALLHVHGHDVRVFGSQVLNRIAGLTGLRADPVVLADYGADGGFVGTEALARLRADVLVAGVDRASLGAGRSFARLLRSPLLQNVPAIRDGHVVEVDITNWVFRSAPAAEQLLADLLEAFPAPLSPR